MSVSLGCALGFAFFGIPIINKWLIKLVNLIADSVTSLLAKLKKTKETDGEDSEGDGTGEQTAAAVARDNDASTSAVLGMSASASVRANPMLWKASTKTNSEKTRVVATEIEMTGFGGIAAAGVLTAVEGEGGAAEEAHRGGAAG